MMKAWGFAAALVTCTASAGTFEECEPYAQWARVVMERRQAGDSMVDMIKSVDGNEAVTGMIQLAFDEPRYMTPEHAERAATEFEAKFLSICLRKD